MPTAPTQDFSFERDIQGYASNYFDTIGNDPRLSPQRKAQLQGTLLGGVEDIQNQRLKLQEERDNGMMRTLKMQGYQSDLEDARAKRIQQRGNERLSSAPCGAHLADEGKGRLERGAVCGHRLRRVRRERAGDAAARPPTERPESCAARAELRHQRQRIHAKR